jgi:ATP-dependent Clp protease protease subunit
MKKAKKVKDDFNGTQAERKLIKQMQSVMSPADAKNLLDTSGVMVPSVRDKDGSGYDIFSLLLKERIVMVNGEVEPAMASVIIAQLKFLEVTQPTDERVGNGITMLINSPGGSVIDGFAIIDVMENLQCEVTTVGVGLQASMGSHILAAGDRRYMAEKASLMIHGAASSTRGKVTQQHNDLNSADRLVEQGYANYIRHIGLTADFWELCDDESWFTAKQAIEMGFIHGTMAPSGDAAKKPVLAAASADKYLEKQAKEREDKVPKDETQILLALHNTKLGNEIRPELLVALAQKAKYWTPELKAQKKLESAAAAINDNQQGATRAAARKRPAKASQGPV